VINLLVASAPSLFVRIGKITCLACKGKHHVKEEEGEMFPKLRKSDIDLVEVGAQLAARKKELMAEMKAAA
jgi:hypothetical protein